MDWMVAAFAGDSTMTNVGTGSVGDGKGSGRVLLVFTFAVDFAGDFVEDLSFLAVLVAFAFLAACAEMEVVARRGQLLHFEKCSGRINGCNEWRNGGERNATDGEGWTVWTRKR